jgi:signal transduction histidine kinase
MKLQSISDLGSQQLIYKEVFFKEIIESILDQFRHEIYDKEVKVHTFIGEHVSFLSYPALIKIVIENLIENSISFIGSQNAKVQIRVESVENGISLIVEDTGGGIDPEYIDRVFEMYFRANEHSKGNGLGLYIVKKVVEKLDGEIEISSTLDKGTVVSVFLPYQHQT